MRKEGKINKQTHSVMKLVEKKIPSHFTPFFKRRIRNTGFLKRLFRSTVQPTAYGSILANAVRPKGK